MSLNNGTYIIKLQNDQKNIYYVHRAFSIENIFSQYDVLFGVLAQAQAFSDFEQALETAIELDMEDPTEFGVWIIDSFAKFTIEELKQHQENNKCMRSILKKAVALAPRLKAA